MNNAWKIVLVVLAMSLPGRAACEDGNDPAEYRLSEPAIHANLAIYFVHGESRSGPVPLTLQEALSSSSISVRETGRVNQLEIENTGDEDIFIQAGDIVKGGQQDRVLSVSLLLPPHSKSIPVDVFCVESGRWTARVGEDSRAFASANASLPSRVAKLEMAGAVAPRPDGAVSAIGSHQQQIWQSVAQLQGRLSNNLGASVAAPKSRTSLQLTLENDRLVSQQSEYVSALQPKGEQADDIVGYVFAVNGKVNSADVYPSNGLFRKMWPKLLRAATTEAISEHTGESQPPPSRDAVNEFMTAARQAAVVEAESKQRTRIEVRENSGAVSLESRPADATANSWIHRSYIAK